MFKKDRGGSPQDPQNYPIKFNNRLCASDYAPTTQLFEVHDLLIAENDELLAQQNEVVTKEIKKLNSLIREAKMPAICVEEQISASSEFLSISSTMKRRTRILVFMAFDPNVGEAGCNHFSERFQLKS